MASQSTRVAPFHINGSVGAGVEQITLTKMVNGLPAHADHFYIRSTHAAQHILISFDGGTSFFTLKFGDPPLKVDWRVESLHIKGSGAATTYEILCMTGKSQRPPY
jgi:hypothetical protein